MQDQRDERQTASAILARGNELASDRADFRSGSIPDQPAGALQDPCIAENFGLRFNFLDTAAKSRRKSCDVQHSVGVAVEEHEDIPRQK